MSLVRIRRQMKYLIAVVWVFVGIFVLSAVYQFNMSAGRSAAAGGGGFARINGQEVSEADFANALSRMREQYRMFASYGSPASMQQFADLPKYAWDQILESYAEAAAAEANGISVSESEADAELSRQIDEQAERLGKGSTPEQLSEIKAALRAGADVQGKQREMLAQRLRDKFTKEARPVEVKVAHVLIKTDKRSDAAALKMAEDVARQAKAGTDFAKLAAQKSEDEGSKTRGGEVGWASAMPPQPPSGKNAKPNPDDATNFVPEFTAASLRLRKGQIAGPVHSQFGYHVIKALDERDYKPKPEAPKPGDKGKKDDPKKQTEQIEQYKNAVASQITQGLFSEYKQRLQSQVVPEDPWLKGYLAEEDANKATVAVDKSGKPVSEKTKLATAIGYYEQAMKTGGAEVGPPLAYHLAQLYQRSEQYPQALALLDKWTKRSQDPEMFVLQGEILEKMNRKTDAVTAYTEAMDHAYNNPELLRRVADKFKPLGRTDLADKATKKQAEQLARQKAESERRAAAMSKPAKISTKPTAAKGKDGDVVQEVQVKTGAVDPKTGKPKIISVTPTKGGKPAASEGTASEKGAAKP